MLLCIGYTGTTGGTGSKGGTGATGMTGLAHGLLLHVDMRNCGKLCLGSCMPHVWHDDIATLTLSRLCRPDREQWPDRCVNLASHAPHLPPPNCAKRYSMPLCDDSSLTSCGLCLLRFSSQVALAHAGLTGATGLTGACFPF